MNKILFNTWNAAFFIEGGGEVQLKQSKIALEKLNYKIDLFDMWNPQKDIDVFHQFSSVPGVEYVIEAYKKIGKKVVLSSIYWDEMVVKNQYFDHYFRLFNSVDAILTNSNLESQLIRKLYNIDERKLFKTRNCISVEYLSFGDINLFRKKFNIESDFILTVANIDERKNVEKLVQACEILNKELVIIGNIRHDHCYDKIKNSKILKYLGPISDKELLKSAYMNCSLFALPSMCETPGIAALEAASQGAKIMITELGSTKEYFEDYATYVNPWKLDSIIEGIQKALSQRNSEQIKLKNIIQKNYTWDLAAQDIVRAYKYN